MKLKFKFKIITLLTLSFLLQSCYMSASISSIDPESPSNPNPIVFKNKINGGEFVSGSGDYEYTQLRRYKVKAAVGVYYSKVYQTTPNGYRIYNSMQGSLISNE